MTTESRVFLQKNRNWAGFEPVTHRIQQVLGSDHWAISSPILDPLHSGRGSLGSGQPNLAPGKLRCDQCACFNAHVPAQQVHPSPGRQSGALRCVLLLIGKIPQKSEYYYIFTEKAKTTILKSLRFSRGKPFSNSIFGYFDYKNLKTTASEQGRGCILEQRNCNFSFTGEGADEIFGGYLYFHNAPNDNEFQQETIRRVKLLSTADCLRADKSCMASVLLFWFYCFLKLFKSCFFNSCLFTQKLKCCTRHPKHLLNQKLKCCTRHPKHLLNQNKFRINSQIYFLNPFM